MNDYHFKSQRYKVIEDTDQEQEFILAPHVVMGEYIKINLIGKPKIQRMDNKHYIALRYVGVKGYQKEHISDPHVQTLLNTFGLYNKKGEEIKEDSKDDDLIL